MNLVERTTPPALLTGRFLGLLLATLSGRGDAQGISASQLQGAENPLTRMAHGGPDVDVPQGTRSRRTTGLPQQAVGPGNNHAGARTTVAVGTTTTLNPSSGIWTTPTAMWAVRSHPAIGFSDR